MSQYHKIQNALDSYLEQEKECDKIGEALNNYNDNFMGEKVGSGKEISTLERDLRNSEAALSHALANLTRIVPEDVCPIGLINRYTEDKAKALQPYA